MDVFITIFLCACMTSGLLMASRRLTHYFQLESYQFYGYFKTILRQWRKAILPGVVMALLVALGNLAGFADPYTMQNAGTLLSIVLVGYVFVVFPACGFVILRAAQKTPEKKKFALTARMKRLYCALGVVCVLLSLLLLLNKWMMYSFLLPLLLPLLTALSGVLILPVERSIFRLYFRDAEKKLTENEKLIRIGITGSYGKTSTKFVLNTLLSQKYNVLATPASFNTPMGVTRIVRERLQPAHQVFIGEMGARHVGEIRELSRLVHPRIGILTAVGPQHLDTFKTLDRIRNTKYELIDALPRDGMAVFLHDDAIVSELYEKTSKPKMLVGREGSDAWAEDISVSHEGSSFTLCFPDGERLSCQTRLLGRHNINNILLAAAVSKYLGLSAEQIIRGVSQLQPVEHRLQLLRSAGGITVIDDAFNTNPRSSREAFQVLSSFPGRHIVVTPGMVELGEEEEKFNYEFGKNMAACADLAVLVGKRHTAPIEKGLLDAGFARENIQVVASLDEAIAFNQKNLRPGDVVMYENDLPDHYSEG